MGLRIARSIDGKFIPRLETNRPIIVSYDKESFEALVKKNFGFAETLFGACFGRIREIGGSDPRDATLVARYSGSSFRFDIGWNELELSLAVLIRFEMTKLPRQERYVYFEPFVEFTTGCKELAIVPYITEKMHTNRIREVMERRRSVFADGLAPVIERVAQKMRLHHSMLVNASEKQIRGYHIWIGAKR